MSKIWDHNIPIQSQYIKKDLKKEQIKKDFKKRRKCNHVTKLPFSIFTADHEVHLSVHRNQVVPEKFVHFLSMITAVKKKKKAFILQSNMLKLIVLGCVGGGGGGEAPTPSPHTPKLSIFLAYPSTTGRSKLAESTVTEAFFCWLVFVQLCFGNWRLLILMIMFYSLTIAHNAIVDAVKLQFLMASKVSFVFSFAKAALLIMQ